MNCSGCMFAEWKEKDQVGCVAGRLSTLIELDKATKTKGAVSFYELHQFCNLYRPNKPADDNQVDKKSELDLAVEQAKPQFGIIIYDEIENDLNKTLDSIQNIDYNKDLIKILISSPVEKGIRYLVTKVNEMKQKDYDCVTKIHSVNNRLLRDKECFSSISCTYFIKLGSGDEISEDFLNNIDLSLNTHLDQIVLFEDRDANVSAVPFGIVSSEYLKYNDYDLMVQEIKNVAIENNKYLKNGQQKQKIYNES